MTQNFKADADFYRDRYEDLRASNERERQRRFQEQKEAREQRRREAEENYRHPDNWADAFFRGIALAEREANSDLALAKEDPDFAPFFPAQVERWKRAKAIWEEETKAAQARIQDLQHQIEMEQANVRQRIAIRIEDDPDGDQELAQAFYNNTPDYLTNW